MRHIRLDRFCLFRWSAGMLGVFADCNVFAACVCVCCVVCVQCHNSDSYLIECADLDAEWLFFGTFWSSLIYKGEPYVSEAYTACKTNTELELFQLENFYIWIIWIMLKGHSAYVISTVTSQNLPADLGLNFCWDSSMLSLCSGCSCCLPQSICMQIRWLGDLGIFHKCEGLVAYVLFMW